MKRLAALLLCAIILSTCVANAKGHRPPKELETKNGWFGTIQAGYNFSFGDDSWNIGRDWKDAKGGGVSIGVGKTLSPLFSAKVKARYLKLYNRVNLEVYDAYKGQFPELFPRKGFYGIDVASLQGEVMFNFLNLFRNRQDPHKFNMYLVAGGGENVAFHYDEIVKDWDGSNAPGLIYHVDTRTHFMPVGVIGGLIDYRVDNDLSLNLELLGSITGDKLEGVKYEEWYDVYITCCLGITVYF